MHRAPFSVPSLELSWCFWCLLVWCCLIPIDFYSKWLLLLLTLQQNYIIGSCGGGARTNSKRTFPQMFLSKGKSFAEDFVTCLFLAHWLHMIVFSCKGGWISRYLTRQRLDWLCLSQLTIRIITLDTDKALKSQKFLTLPLLKVFKASKGRRHDKMGGKMSLALRSSSPYVSGSSLTSTLCWFLEGWDGVSDIQHRAAYLSDRFLWAGIYDEDPGSVLWVPFLKYRLRLHSKQKWSQQLM